MIFTNLELELFSYSIPMIFLFYFILKSVYDKLFSFILGFSISYLIIFFGTDLNVKFAKDLSIVWQIYSGLTFIFIFYIFFGKYKTVITI